MRLGYLLFTLKEYELDKYRPLINVLNFALMVATYSRGFALYFDPFPELSESNAGMYQLVCLDPAMAFAPASKCRNVVLVAGNLTPLGIYAKLLELKCKTQAFLLDPSLAPLYYPLVVSRATDNVGHGWIAE